MSTKDYNATLPSNICNLITERGLKQGAVATMAGLSARQLSDMLNGRRIIKPCDIRAIAEALGVTPNELYGITPNGNETGKGA